MEDFMKQWLIRGTLVPFLILPFFLIPTVGGAEELTPAQQQAVKQEVQRILGEQGYTKKGGKGSGEPPSTSGSRSVEDLYKSSRTGETKSGSTKEGSGALIYARPFVANPKAIIGGYTDIEYFNRKNDGVPSTFDQHRFVPFWYADVSDRVKVAVELEIEHGGRGTTSNGGLDIGVEFMTIDYLVNEPLNLRAGIILVPLGKFNLLHDAPLRDLTDRPLVDVSIIPAALRQAGAGIYGTFYPTQLSKLDYEIYITNGFTRDNVTGSGGVRGARFPLTGGDDNNDGKAVTGRVAFSPFLGVEIGGSGFHGMYQSSGTRDKSLTITALDWTLQRGPFELIGEAAWAWAPDNLAPGAMPSPTNGATEDMFGYYVQVNYHFLPTFLTTWAPTFFTPDTSTFTLVLRWDQMDLNTEVDGNFSANRERERLTAGLNFRPLEDSVFKIDLQYEPKAFGVSGGASVPVQDTAFVASWATYF
jgi:hypothetical protein